MRLRPKEDLKRGKRESKEGLKEDQTIKKTEKEVAKSLKIKEEFKKKRVEN
jgi:hypothetical protein